MPNWDDDFDFQDIENDKKKTKPSAKSKQNKAVNDQDDFFDNEISSKKKQSMSILPSINPRSSDKVVPANDEKSNKQNPYTNKQLGSKPNLNNSYQEYYDEDIEQQVVESKKNNKESAKQIVKSNNDKGKNNINLDKSNISDQYNQEVYEQQLEEPIYESKKNVSSNNKVQKVAQKNIPKPTINNLQSNNKINSIQTKETPQIKSNKNHSKQKQNEDQYDDQFQNDQYGNDDDFQEETTKSLIKILPKQNKQHKNTTSQVKTNNLTSNNRTNSKQIQTQVRSPSVVPPKPPLNDKKSIKNVAVSNRNLNKIQSHSVNKKLLRSNSRSSVRSINQKNVQGSRVTQKNQSQYFPNKHYDMVQRSFPQDQNRINTLNQNQINKINEKMRAMIRKFNQQLNELINKNMLVLKNKVNQKQLSVDQRIKQLQIQKKSGDTAIQVMEKDFDKLQGRQGELKEQEYQLILQKQIEQKKNQLKQTLKQITVIKRQVDTKGKKLSIKQQEQRNAQNIHHLKTTLIQMKKDEQKGDQRIQKLILSHEQLQTKISDLDYKLDELVSQAKQKGINIENNQNIVKKFDDYKVKLQNIKNFNKKSQSLISTKLDILNHENEQIRLTIRNINSQINNFYGSIDHSQNQSIRMIEKAKQKTNINPLFSQSLDKLLKQLQQSKANTDYFQVRSQVKSRRSDSSRHKSIKNSQQNIEKSMPLRVNQLQNKIIDQQDNLVKPKFMKKKVGQEAKLNVQGQQRLDQRVWIEQQQHKSNRIIQNNENRISIQTPKNKIGVQKADVQIQQKKDKSKPFSLIKRNKNDSRNDDKNQHEKLNDISKQLKSIQVEKHGKVSQQFKIQQKSQKSQQQPNINVAPRMIKFGKKKNELSPSENEKSFHQQKTPVNTHIKQDPPKKQIPDLQLNENKASNEQTQKAIFVPKRFNLRNKADKKDDSYMPSVKQNVTQLQKQKPTKPLQKEDYKPKFDFKNQQAFKIKEEPKQTIQNLPKSISQQPDIKPKFNLRLRDRKQNNEQQTGYGYGIDKNNHSINKPADPITNKDNELNNKKQISLNNGNNVNNINETKALNPYAPKVPQKNISLPQKQTQNPYAPKIQQVTNPYAPKYQNVNNNIISKTTLQNPQPIVQNPYAQNALNSQPIQRQRGPLKKNKIGSSNMPKQSFNIYEQAEDATRQIPNIGGMTQKIDSNAVNKLNNQGNKNIEKTQQLNLNQMLGIKKSTKNNDFDDLLGNVGSVAPKNKIKNKDFFGDLDL